MVLDLKYYHHWLKIKDLTGGSNEKLISIIEMYINILSASQHDTYTNPFEIVSPNMSKLLKLSFKTISKFNFFILVLGLDIVTPESLFGYEPETMQLPTADQMYTTERVVIPDTSDFFRNEPTTPQSSGPLVSFPKYNNYLQDKSKFDKYSKILVPLKLLGIKPLEHGEHLTRHALPDDGAVISYAEYRQAGALLPSVYDDSVVRRWGVDITIGSPVLSVSILVPEYVEAITKNNEYKIHFQDVHDTNILTPEEREKELKRILIEPDDKNLENEAHYMRLETHRAKREKSLTKKLLYKNLSGVSLTMPVRYQIWLDPDITLFNERSNPQCVHWTTARG